MPSNPAENGLWALIRDPYIITVRVSRSFHDLEQLSLTAEDQSQPSFRATQQPPIGTGSVVLPPLQMHWPPEHVPRNQSL